MASPQIPVVDIPDDDDDDLAAAAFASPPSSRKRSHGSAASTSTSSADFLDAFSPSQSPPLHKRLMLAAADRITLDDTPSPPKRRPSSSSSSASAPKPPVLVVDDDDDPSAPDDVVHETPDSVLARVGLSETPEAAVLGSAASPGTVVAETPGFTSPRPVGSPAAHGLSSAAPAHKFSGVSSIIPLDSDCESDDDATPLINLSSNTPKSDIGVEPGSSFYFGTVDAGTHNDQNNYLKPSAGCDTTISARVPEVKRWQKKDDAQHMEVKQQRQPEGKKLTKEEKAEERKQKRQEDKLQKALKAQLADKKKMDKEIQKWESGKLSLECITAQIDSRIIESGSIGGTLLSSLSENGLRYKSTNNEISGSILWKMDVPDNIAQVFSSLNHGCNMDPASVSRVKYIAIVLQAEEFCDLISSGAFFNHVEKVQNTYPNFTICYITNKLMSYINKREQSEYKKKSNTWKRPPVEEVLCKLATHYTNVHSRQCIDEAEVAEHLVGLTSNLAKCQFRKPLSWLSVHANGAIIPKGFVDKNLAKKDTWLKALIAIPEIQPRYAMAIRKKYPCMRSLLNEYMDSSKTVLEKELLLSDLKWENRLGDEAKRLGHKCSRRVYRMLMAENGDLDTDDPEAGGSG